MKDKQTNQQFFDKLNDEQKTVSIPYYLHEGEMFRLERLNKRWFIAFLIVLVMLFVTNGAWIIYENQFKDEVITVEQQVDTDEGTTVISGTGDAIYGENSAKNHDQAAGGEDQPSTENVPDL